MLQSRFSQAAGPWLLYFVLMAMRAQADFLPSGKDFIMVLAGLVWLLIHGSLMVGYAKIFQVLWLQLLTSSSYRSMFSITTDNRKTNQA